jgi:hypothetical protein
LPAGIRCHQKQEHNRDQADCGSLPGSSRYV